MSYVAAQRLVTAADGQVPSRVRNADRQVPAAAWSICTVGDWPVLRKLTSAMLWVVVRMRAIPTSLSLAIAAFLVSSTFLLFRSPCRTCAPASHAEPPCTAHQVPHVHRPAAVHSS